MLDYENISSRAGERFHLARLSAFMQTLLLDYLETITRGDWTQPGGDDNSDTIMAELAQGANALMDNLTVGEIVWYATSTPPAHVLLCDGSEYARADYPALFAVIDANYLIDPDTFRVPDLIGRFMRGGSEAGITGGADTHTLTESEMPYHTHTTGNSFTGLALMPGEGPVLTPNPLPAWTGGAGGSQAHNNVPRYETALPCIIAY